MFSAGNVLTLAIALLSVAATWGAILWRVTRVEKDVEGLGSRLRELDQGREKQGKRIGVVEGKVERLFERTEAPAPGGRRRSTTLPAIPAGDEGEDS